VVEWERIGIEFDLDEAWRGHRVHFEGVRVSINTFLFNCCGLNITEEFVLSRGKLKIL
jgi:hypothetical protein